MKEEEKEDDEQPQEEEEEQKAEASEDEAPQTSAKRGRFEICFLLFSWLFQPSPKGKSQGYP